MAKKREKSLISLDEFEEFQEKIYEIFKDMLIGKVKGTVMVGMLSVLLFERNGVDEELVIDIMKNSEFQLLEEETNH